MIYTHHYDTPLGPMTAVSDGKALTGLMFHGQHNYDSMLHTEQEEKALPVFDDVRRWLEIFFSGREPDFTPSLSLRGTPFRQSVWEAVLAVPYGTTTTYGELADRIARKENSSVVSATAPRTLEQAFERDSSASSPPVPRTIPARAVGQALGHNPVLLIVPCHRVIGADGRLTGYAGGIQRKKILLAMEAGFEIPTAFTTNIDTHQNLFMPVSHTKKA